MAILQKNEEALLIAIKKSTEKGNKDNISRTKAYEKYFGTYPEIKWAFLAGMVSRNAGYNMCDLEGYWYPKVLSKSFRRTLFLTYERANWLIFSDAYPQLLLYHYSTISGKPLFHLAKYLNISSFIIGEWMRFWKKRDEKRLIISLIINEQHVIQRPVIENTFYNRKVFRSLVFNFQDFMHFSSVLFPTRKGQLFGSSVSNFRKVDVRIELGKRLSEILFTPELFPAFYDFAQNTEPTGSRYDYEQYFANKKMKDTPMLRCTYPIITHQISIPNKWDQSTSIKNKWFREPKMREPILLSQWYQKKQKQLQALLAVENYFVKDMYE
ncbi:DUF2515 domain-containing protein [Peribacillus tepidiphilus]|uniref:DUF2515 domain-containing protein n=1 Tax=Peribacillus tepidiphilus TaxID=2652445 RepID=UPI001292744E|nr:DUF2515 domain-containing protein [Peribacillus tepidiphilus]